MLDLGDQRRLGLGPAKGLAPASRRPHASRHTLANEGRFQLGHRADDGEHGPAHGAIGINLVLNTDEAHREVLELLLCVQEVLGAAGKPVELPDQLTSFLPRNADRIAPECLIGFTGMRSHAARCKTARFWNAANGSPSVYQLAAERLTTGSLCLSFERRW